MNQTILLIISTYQIDTWYHDEPVEPESGQNPTSQTMAKFACFKLLSEDIPYRISYHI